MGKFVLPSSGAPLADLKSECPDIYDAIMTGPLDVSDLMMGCERQ
ncbi:MAG: hypothetical protein AB7V46_16630 [Thermomicrobiales bacterium]